MQAPAQPPGFFPATTYFTDCMSALPREIMKHITMLHEASGKLCRPEDELENHLVAALHAPVPPPRIPDMTDTADNGARQDDADQVITNGFDEEPAPMTEKPPSVEDEKEIARRADFHSLRMMIAEILPTLDERNHVISTANEALSRQLAKVENVYPAVKGEVSDEVKYGNPNHWAYIEKRKGKTGGPIGSRRDIAGTNSLAAAAALDADTISSRSESRREAMMARKRNHHLDSDFETREYIGVNGQNGKKSHGNSRKRVAEGMPLPLPLPSLGHPQPTQKRRKTEKLIAVTGPPHLMAASIMQNGLNGKKGGLMSPRADLAGAEMGRKRSRPVNPTTTTTKKRTNAPGTATSPNFTSSPVVGTFSSAHHRSSPVPGPPSRPGTSRGRQNSGIISGTEGAVSRRRQSPSGVEGLGLTTETGPFEGQENGLNGNGQLAHIDGIIIPEENAYSNGHHAIDNPPQSLSRTTSRGKHGSPTIDNHPQSRNHRPSRSIDSFHHANLATASDSKPKPRSHKKGASSRAALAASVNGDDGSSMAGDDEDEDDADEPRYCYCNNVSYGEMVACDADDCKREWFHMSCVGLQKAPGKNTKWYCDECKENMRKGKPNGGTSRRLPSLLPSAA